MATRRHRRRTTSSAATPRHRRTTPGWVLVVAGLAIGALGVGTWTYVRGRLAAPPAAPAAQSTPSPKSAPAPARNKASQSPPEKRYGFYEMLPNFEVVVPEEDKDVRTNKTPAPIEAPGVYVLQAGSYATFAEADRVKARLALLGISSQIQKITVDDREYHRVRIGPIEDLAELNRTRARLRTSKIDALVIRVGE